MNQIKKNRFTLSKSENNAEQNDSSTSRIKLSKLSNRKKQIIIALSILVIAITSVLTLTKYFGKPRIFAPQDKSKTDQAPVITYTDKNEIPESSSDNIHLQRGKDNFYKGYFNNAIAEFTEVIESDASDIDKAVALTYMGIIENERNNYLKALDYYNRALKYNPKNSITYRNIAITYKERKDFDNALKNINKAIELDASNTNNHLLQGNIYFLMHKYNTAMEAYKRVIDIEPENASALYNTALCLSSKGDIISASDYLLLAAKADKSGKIAYLAYSELGNYALNDNDLKNAATYLKKAISLNPNDATDHYNLAIIYLKQGYKPEALKEFSIAEKLGNENIEILESLGLAYHNLNDYNKSLNIYDKILKINSKNINALSQIGDLYFKKGDILEALKAYKKITELRPASEHARIAYLNIGNILDDAARYEESIEAYEKALSINPKDDSTFYNMGITYKHAKNNEKAIESWRKAIQINPDNPKPHMSLADLLYESGYLDDAITEYKTITDKWPNFPDAHFSLATIYHKKNLIDYAQKRYQKVIILGSSQDLNIKSYINLAIISSEDEKDDESLLKAVSYIQKALLLKPEDPGALYSLGIIYYKKGSYDRAIETFYQVIKGTVDEKMISLAYNNIGKSHFKKEEFRKALRAFTIGIEEDPTNEEIRINRKAAMQAYEQGLAN